VDRLGAVSPEVTLAAGQLAIAREHGLASWPALMGEIEARDRSLEEAVQMFLAASVGYRIGRAVRLLAEHPEIAEHSLQTALVLGDHKRIARELAADPGLPRRRDCTG